MPSFSPASSGGSRRRRRRFAPDRRRSRSPRPVDVEPLDVGAEARLAGEVERQMHAEAAGLGHRIDQARERRPSGEREVVALGEPLARHAPAASPSMRRASAGALSPAALTSTPASISIGASPPTRSRSRRRERPRFRAAAQDERAAGVLEIALVGEHQRVAVDDPGRRESSAASPSSAGSSSRASAPLSQRSPSTPLACARCSIARSARSAPASPRPRACRSAGADAARFAIRVEQAPARDAEPRLQRAGA